MGYLDAKTFIGSFFKETIWIFSSFQSFNEIVGEFHNEFP